ncbi:hypothetical protein DL95DRAFT_152368 [Leptodontidium sp. 2 PMI_412]|nr:hypothetical protein DL95DRAFT_152368 [Leptodontidium sp. 2 PMI_412]
MNMLSETIRLEIEPLGIKTIIVIAGIVKSNFFANLPTSQLPAEETKPAPRYKLPEGSYYKSLEAEISKAAAGEISAGKNIMTAEAFGTEVVNDVLRGRSGRTYSGTLGWGAKWIPMFPVAWLDTYCKKRGALRSFVRVDT